LTFKLLQFLRLDALTGLLLFDFVKRELRGIRKLARPLGYDVIVCRHEYLRINLLDPEGIDPALNVNVCAEFLTLGLSLPPVAKHILKICITRLYERFGMFLDPNALPPTLSDLIAEVENFDGHKAAKEAILIRLQALLANKRQVFDVRKGYQIGDLQNRFIDFELDGLEAYYQNLIVFNFIGKLFAWRVAHCPPGLIIVGLDEANRVYSKRAESSNEGPSFIDMMTSVVRQKQIGIFAFVQTCHDLSNSIIANSGTKILLRAGSAQDYDVFGKAMGLSSEQREWAKIRLRPGAQIIKKTASDWQEPFVNYSPMVTIPEDVSDSEVRQSVQPLLDAIPKPVVPRLLLPSHIELAGADQTGPQLSPEEDRLLNQVKNHPEIASATDHYRMAGLSTKKATAAKGSLVGKHLLKETPVEPGRRGGAQLFLEAINRSEGRDGHPLHRHLKKKPQAWYIQRGCLVEEEKRFVVDAQPVFVDLTITRPDGTTEAIEVETEASPRAVANIKKDLSIGFQRISVVTPNRKVREAIRMRVSQELAECDRKRVRFPAICSFD
jgi:hypothetical protein